MTKQEIINLIRNQLSESIDLQYILDNENKLLFEINFGFKDIILDVNKRRFKHNLEYNKQEIIGMKTLLENLEIYNGEKVGIIEVSRSNVTELNIVIDEGLTKIFGIIYFENNKVKSKGI